MNPRAIEAGAEAIYATVHDPETYPFESASKLERRLAMQHSRSVFASLKAEGFVVVPKETFFEIANRAGNMSDPDAADWLPSIYRIAMEAAGEDPWPTLRRHGYDPDNLSVSFDTMAKNGEARAAAQEPNDASD